MLLNSQSSSSHKSLFDELTLDEVVCSQFVTLADLLNQLITELSLSVGHSVFRVPLVAVRCLKSHQLFTVKIILEIKCATRKILFVNRK